MIHFANPEWLWLLNAIPLLLLWYFLGQKKMEATVQLPAVSAQRLPATWRSRMRHLLVFLRIVAVATLIVAMARPQAVFTKKMVASEGIDIMLALDISGSMLTRDFIPNRLEAAKQVAIEFIGGRPNDRIGVVFFAGEAYTGCPITLDHKALQQIITSVKTGSIADGTAIGMGLGTAAMRLMDNQSENNVIILVTDGENNAGNVMPLEAAQLVRTNNIHTYCIGIFSPTATQQPATENDSTYIAIGGPTAEITLLQIAEITGGHYFRAGNAEKLSAVYREIDNMEKTKVDVVSYNRYEEQFMLLALLAALLLLTEMILRYTIFRTAP